MMNCMRKGIKLYKNKFIYFIKRQKSQILLSLISSLITSLIFYFIIDIPLFYFVFLPPLILVFYKQKIFNKITILSKILIFGLSSTLIIFLISLVTTFIINKAFIFILVVVFYLFLFTLISFIIYFILVYFSKNEFLFLGVSIVLSFVTSILSKSLILSLIIFSSLIFIFSFIYFLFINKQKSSKKSKVIFALILMTLAIISFFLIQIIDEKKEGNLLTESLFKFNFNDQVNLKTDYKFKGILLFIAKLEDSKLLKAVSYPEFSREKGFYFINRDLPFPAFLSLERWEDESYIKGKRNIEKITCYNLNLSDGTVFGPNEPFKIVPYQKVSGSKFTSIFSTYSKTIEDLENQIFSIEFSHNNLQDDLYKKYTYFGKKDPLIEDLILKYKEFYNNEKEFILFFYYFFKKNYFYSISTFQDEGYNGIISFLFKTKKGYCAHFASAYALLLRYYGIPCRVVGGFKAIEDNKILDYYRFYDFNAHSWVEIYTDEYGWVPIDPTSDRIAEDEMLPFEKPSDQDEAALLEEILKLEKNLIPQKNIMKNNEKIEKENIKFDFNYLIYFIIFILIISFIFLIKNEIIIILSLIFPVFLNLSIKIYIKRIAKLLKKDFITAEEVKESLSDGEIYFEQFADIYNCLLFAPESKKNEYRVKEKSMLIYNSYKKIISKIKKLQKYS